MSVKKFLIKDMLKKVDNINNYYFKQFNNSFILIVTFKTMNNQFETNKILNFLKMFNIEYRIIDNDLLSISIDIQ